MPQAPPYPWHPGAIGACPPRPTARETHPSVAPGLHPRGFQHPCCCGGGSLTLSPCHCWFLVHEARQSVPGPPLTARPALLADAMASVLTGFSAPWTAPPPSWEGAHLTGTAVGTGGPAPWWPHSGRTGPAGQPSGARGRNISLLSAGISPRDFTWASGSTSSEKSSPDTSVQTPVSTPSFAGKQVPVSTALLPGPPRSGDRHAR